MTKSPTCQTILDAWCGNGKPGSVAMGYDDGRFGCLWRWGVYGVGAATSTEALQKVANTDCAKEGDTWVANQGKLKAESSDWFVLTETSEWLTLLLRLP